MNQFVKVKGPKTYKRMPWKNGLGETLEIERFDDAKGLAYRISQAAVIEDGVFSDFSGLNRTLVLISGAGMTLMHSNSEQHELVYPLDMAKFSGGEVTQAKLHHGAIEDLNIMVREDDYLAEVSPMLPLSEYRWCASENTVYVGIYAVSQCAFRSLSSQTELDLEAGAMLKFDVTDSIDLIWLSGQAVLIKIVETPQIEAL